MINNLNALGNGAVLFLGALSFGTVTSYPSPAIMSLTEEKPQLGEERFKSAISWFSNAPRLSAAIGPFLMIPILPRIGRKYALSIVSFLLCISWFLLFLIDTKDKKNDVPFNIEYGVVVRTIMGLFWGTTSVLTITFIIEIAPSSSYGLFGSIYQLFIILGICLTNILGAFVNWKILIIINAIINLIFSICLLVKEDSPVSQKLKVHKSHHKKHSSSKCFHCHLFRNIDESAKINGFGSNESYVRTVISSMFILFFQQYCGINAILNNLSSIMTLSGLSMNPNLQSAMSTLAQLLACLIASFLMDNIGPRILWLTSTAGCLISLSVYAYCIFDYQTLMTVPRYIPVLAVFVYCLFFGLGQGPAPWAIFPGLFPDLLRYEGICCMLFSHWFISFVVCYTHPIITEKVGEFYAILVYIICSIGAIIYGIFFIPKKENINPEDFTMF